MKKTGLVCLLAGSFALSGCLVTKSDLKENDTRKAKEDQVTTMQKANAEAVNRNNELEASLREMDGRLGVVENRVNQQDQNAGRGQKQLEDSLAESNKKVALLQDEMTKMEGQIQALSEQVAASNAAAAAAASAAATRSDERPAAGGKASKEAYFDAGEDHFSKKEWKKAIFNYQKYRDTQAKGKKFPEATYKIGVCFQELGMKDEAKTFYDELVAKFPSSPEARRARIRLKKLK